MAKGLWGETIPAFKAVKDAFQREARDELRTTTAHFLGGPEGDKKKRMTNEKEKAPASSDPFPTDCSTRC